MYPEKPWKNISKGAILCIQHFLVVQHDARYTVDQALLDPWLRDTQCLVDIARLEEEVGVQWLTKALDQAGNSVENDSDKSNSSTETSQIIIVCFLILCFLLKRNVPRTFDLPALFLGI